MDTTFAKDLGIPLFPLSSPLRVLAIDDTPLTSGIISEMTGELTLMIGTLHKKKWSFLVINCSSALAVLGLLWLSLHNPSID